MKKSFYHALFSLVLPITLQNFLNAAVNFADVFMLGFVGQSALSAVSLANQYQFIQQGFFFGISSGITMLCSQYWGKQDRKAVQAVMGIAAKIGWLVTAVMAILAVLLPKYLMLVFTNDSELVEIGAGYLRIIGISYFIMSFSIVYESTLRSVEQAMVSTVISGSALLINVFLNAVFIFGLFGAPKLGVYGVAIATLIARVIELFLCLVHLLRSSVFQPDFSVIFGHSGQLFRDFLTYSLPALMNDIFWTLAFSVYSMILGHLNSDVVAANAVITNVRDLCMILCFGLASGGAVLLGKTIGSGKMEEAEEMGKRLTRMAFGFGALTGLLILALRPLIPYLFDLTDRAQYYLGIMFFINSYYVIGQSVNTMLIAGIFRAGGNSRFGLICDVVMMWAISVPIGLLSAFVWNAPPIVVYFLLCLDEFWKIPVVIKHYRSKKWLRDITREELLS